MCAIIAALMLFLLVIKHLQEATDDNYLAA
jgi:hypothetical protein